MAVESGAGPGDFAIPDALPVLPLRDMVPFPLTAFPLAVGQPRFTFVDDAEEVLRHALTPSPADMRGPAG